LLLINQNKCKSTDYRNIAHSTNKRATMLTTPSSLMLMSCVQCASGGRTHRAHTKRPGCKFYTEAPETKAREAEVSKAEVSEAEINEAEVNEGEVSEAEVSKGSTASRAISENVENEAKITLGYKASSAAYINARVQRIVGHTIQQALGMMVRNTRGQQVEYQRKDMLYDSRSGFICLPGQTQLIPHVKKKCAPKREPEERFTDEDDSWSFDKEKVEGKRQRKSTAVFNLGASQLMDQSA
jgi:hypothetical protein